MKFYYRYVATYHNETLIGTNVGTMLTAEEPTAEVINLTWDNLQKYYSEDGLSYKFNIWNFKRGRRVSFFLEKVFLKKDERDIKEWKEDLNIQIKITYREYTPTIAEVLNWHEMEKVAIYLKEKGIKIER